VGRTLVSVLDDLLGGLGREPALHQLLLEGCHVAARAKHELPKLQEHVLYETKFKTSDVQSPRICKTRKHSSRRQPLAARSVLYQTRHAHVIRDHPSKHAHATVQTNIPSASCCTVGLVSDKTSHVIRDHKTFKVHNDTYRQPLAVRSSTRAVTDNKHELSGSGSRHPFSRKSNPTQPCTPCACASAPRGPNKLKHCTKQLLISRKQGKMHPLSQRQAKEQEAQRSYLEAAAFYRPLAHFIIPRETSHSSRLEGFALDALDATDRGELKDLSLRLLRCDPVL
jgi:hypothetical protein